MMRAFGEAKLTPAMLNPAHKAPSARKQRIPEKDFVTYPFPKPRSMEELVRGGAAEGLFPAYSIEDAAILAGVPLLKRRREEA